MILSMVVSCVNPWFIQNHNIRYSVVQLISFAWTRRRRHALVGLTGPPTRRWGRMRWGAAYAVAGMGMHFHK